MDNVTLYSHWGSNPRGDLKPKGVFIFSNFPLLQILGTILSFSNHLQWITYTANVLENFVLISLWQTSFPPARQFFPSGPNFATFFLSLDDVALLCLPASPVINKLETRNANRTTLSRSILKRENWKQNYQKDWRLKVNRSRSATKMNIHTELTFSSWISGSYWPISRVAITYQRFLDPGTKRTRLASSSLFLNKTIGTFLIACNSHT